jgi:hypothetical protein
LTGKEIPYSAPPPDHYYGIGGDNDIPSEEKKGTQGKKNCVGKGKKNCVLS